jgi:ATP-dependent DNA ligase
MVFHPCRGRPPAGPDWIHETKHFGYRPMARRDPVGIRLITPRTMPSHWRWG